MKIIDTKNKEVVFTHGSMYPVGATAASIEAAAVRAEAAAADAEAAANAVTPNYSTRADLIADLSNIPAGKRVAVDGVYYIVDPSATGLSSAMWDIGVDGVTSPDRPVNGYVSGFHDLNSPRVVRLYSSNDGDTWRMLNALSLKYPATGISGGNPVIKYRDGWFYIALSYLSTGVFDFRIYKTRDFTNFQLFNCTAGPTALSSTTTPAPGASVPADEIWGVEIDFTPSGELHVFMTVKFGPDTVDFEGASVGNRRIYRCKCNDLEALTFDYPVLVLPAGNNFSMIDASTTRVPSGWLFTVKDEINKTIRIYRGAAITGPWTLQEVVTNSEYRIEGSAVVPRRVSDTEVHWDLYVEGHDTREDNIRTTRMMVYKGGAATSGWASITPTMLYSSRGIRHGTPFNFGFEDPAAFKAFAKYAAISAGDAPEMPLMFDEIGSGARRRSPQQDFIYFVTGNAVQTDLTLIDGAAQSFYLACMSDAADTGIVVKQDGFPNAWSSVGFGVSNNTLIQYVKRPDTGRYYPVGGNVRAFVEANKGGTDQTVTAGGITQVTFTNEVADFGGFFSGSVWTPPAGRYRIVATITIGGTASGDLNYISIRKNETAVSTSRADFTVTDQTIMVEAYVTTSGGSTFDVAASFAGAGSRMIKGGGTVTSFVGYPA